MEKKLKPLIEGILNSLGFGLVQLLVKSSVNKLEILIEKLNGEKVSVEDCKLVHRNVLLALGVENTINEKFFIEVSSAGVERPLVTLKDFKNYIGSLIKIRLKEPHNGNLSFKGTLLFVSDKIIRLQSKKVQLEFDYINISRANLVFTDEMFKQLLKNSQK